MRGELAAILLLCGTWIGCGTSKWTDTQRTATEQLLISDAMDRAVSQLDFRALAGKKVYLDTTPLKTATDAGYLTSTLRQHMLASGCVLKDKMEEADYVIEARAGSTGTDHHDLLFGVPHTTVPSPILFGGTVATSSTIPELPLAKKMDQRAIVKIALFAYNRSSGRPVWQSGLVLTESKAKHIWLLGTGPFQRGTIYNGTCFVGDRLKIPLIDPDDQHEGGPSLSIADEAYFIEPTDSKPQPGKAPLAQGPAAPPEKAKQASQSPSQIQPAGHTAPMPESKSPQAQGPGLPPEKIQQPSQRPPQVQPTGHPAPMPEGDYPQTPAFAPRVAPLREASPRPNGPFGESEP